MKNWAMMGIIISTFFLGMVISSTYSIMDQNLQSPAGFLNNEKISPSDHVKENQIKVFDDKVVIDVQDAIWAKFTDTNSMDPIFDQGHNSIEVKPNKPEDIKIGDIVSYESKYVDGIIIHRVISISEDSDGIYYILKGDNNPDSDPGKIRFNQIHGILVAIIY